MSLLKLIFVWLVLAPLSAAAQPSGQAIPTSVTDTSPYRDPSDLKYISTGEYIRNMNLLVNFNNSFRKELYCM
jgi:hypothetical protein